VARAGWSVRACCSSPSPRLALPDSATAALAAWLDLKSRREEAWLRGHYPEYEAYRRRTHRFIPGAY